MLARHCRRAFQGRARAALASFHPIASNRKPHNWRGALRPRPFRAAQHGRTALHAAAEKGHLEVSKTLLESGADLKSQDKDGRTPLHKACERGCLAVGAMLLEAKADVNARDLVRARPARLGMLRVLRVFVCYVLSRL